MSGNDKGRLESLGVAVVGFVLVIGAGTLAFPPEGGVLMAWTPPARTSPVFAVRSVPPSPLPVRAEAGAAVDSSAARPPFAGRSDRSDSSAGMSGAASSVALVVTGHLDATQTTSAEASPAPNEKEADAEAALEAGEATPKPDAPKDSGIAATVRYGVNRRSELMGRAAGPVYNFKGRSAGAGWGDAADLSGAAAVRIEEVRRRLEQAELEGKDKEALRQSLQQVREGLDEAGQ